MTTANAQQTNGRTHEPDLREAVMQIDDLKELFGAQMASLTKLMDERDRLYSERSDAQGKAIDAALHTAERQTASAFTASEKAIVKAEHAQHEYNERSNEFRAALDDAQKLTVSRNESNAEFNRVNERIADIKKELAAFRAQGAAELAMYRESVTREISSLREWKSETKGHDQGSSVAWFIISGIVGVVGVLVGASVHFLMMMGK